MIDSYNLKTLEALEAEINIHLLNAAINFVHMTTDKQIRQYKLSEIPLWHVTTAPDCLQQEYGFQYFGELLERYEEKVGKEIETIRAVALALAITFEYQTDNMFIGRQRDQFIAKVKRLAKDDTYLKGALYLISAHEGKEQILYTELTGKQYEKTEELLFTLSLFEDFEKAFGLLKPQLLRLLGKHRTMTVIHNIGFFRWLISKLAPIIKSCRKNDMALFRSLVSLPAMYAKDGCKPRTNLLEHHFTIDEIVYANAALLFERPYIDTVQSDSIVAEKIIIEFCHVFINSAQAHSQNTYDFISWLLNKYRKFPIKIQGHVGLYQALKGEIELSNPQTFLWLYESMQRKNRYDLENVFVFDILDCKWDAIVPELDQDQYRQLFDKHLTENDFSSEECRTRIQKYDSLTGLSYLRSFEEYLYRWTEFGLMVKTGLIDLVKEFDKCKQLYTLSEKQSSVLQYIAQYVGRIPTREAFTFFQYFFERHNANDISKFLQISDFSYGLFFGLQRYYGSTQRPIELERSFLSDDEHRQLFAWLDDYMFTCKPQQYIEFCTCVLEDVFLDTILPKESLQQLFNSIYPAESEKRNNCKQKLKEKYLTPEEMQTEKEAKAEKLRLMELEKEEQEKCELQLKLMEKFDGSFQSLKEFHRSNDYWEPKRRNSLLLVMATMTDALDAKGYSLGCSDLGNFIQLCGMMLQYNIMTLEVFRSHIQKIEEIEDAEYA